MSVTTAKVAGVKNIIACSPPKEGVGAHPAITAPIIGARNTDQLEGSLTSMQINMTNDLYASISELSPLPPLPTDREDERAR